MSLLGFYEGWRIGWTYATGQQMRGLIESTAPARWLRALLLRTRAQ